MTVWNNGIREKHPGRIWDVSTWDERYKIFKTSQVVSSYLTINNFKLPSRSSLFRHSCKCLANPTSKSCVDIIKSALFHYRIAIANELRNNLQLKNKLLTCTCPLHTKDKDNQWTSHLHTSVEKFIYFSTCERVSHPELACEEYVPKFIPWDCANGICAKCGPSTINLTSCPILISKTNNIPTNE